jgi:hypothetical protein
MGSSWDLIFWIFAFVCFVIATFIGDRLPRVNLIALGLAFGALTFITG